MELHALGRVVRSVCFFSNNPAVCLSMELQALGCVLFLLCYGEHPFEDSAKLRIINGKYMIPESDTQYTVFHDLLSESLAFVQVVGNDFDVDSSLWSSLVSHAFYASGKDDDRFYVALFPALEQTHCVLVARDAKWMASFLQRGLNILPGGVAVVVFVSDTADATWNCCRLRAFWVRRTPTRQITSVTSCKATCVGCVCA